MHLSIMLLPLLPFALSSHTSSPRRHRSRSPQHAIVGRAGAPYSNDTIEYISEAAAYSASLAAAGDVASASTSLVPSATVSSVASSAAITAEVTSSVDGDLASSAVVSSVVISSAGVSSVAPASSLIISSVLPVISTTADIVTAPITSPLTSIAPVTSDVAAPSTTLPITSAILPSTVVVTHSSLARITTATRTASSSSSASAAASKESTSSSGINKTTLVAIIVVASVVGLAAAAFTAFRKWKLKPSNRFDKRMKPIDFSPKNGGMDDDFLEKSLQRTTSTCSADRQRQQYASELDTSGIPDHDFTAGINGAGHGTYDMNMYDTDPYAHAEAYDYDAQYQYQQQQNQHQQYPPASYQGDYPTQDEPVGGAGYADLQRGNSVGSGSGHGHAHGGAGVGQHVYPEDFPTPGNYLGRPTGGSDGPYAQAAQYRAY